jgi:WD40 repeat protein
LLATASLDSTVRVWRVVDGSCVQTLEGPGDGVEWVTWHPKGDVVLAGSEDFTLWMWLAQSGNCMQVCCVNARMARVQATRWACQVLLSAAAARPTRTPCTLRRQCRCWLLPLLAAAATAGRCCRCCRCRRCFQGTAAP